MAIYKQKSVSYSKLFLTLSLLDQPKPATLLFYPVKCQMILLIKGEPLGGKWLTIILSLQVQSLESNIVTWYYQKILEVQAMFLIIWSFESAPTGTVNNL